MTIDKEEPQKLAINLLSAELVSGDCFLEVAAGIYNALIISRGVSSKPEEQMHQAIALISALLGRL
jgi:hypothetical protein